MAVAGELSLDLDGITPPTISEIEEGLERRLPQIEGELKRRLPGIEEAIRQLHEAQIVTREVLDLYIDI